MLEAITTGENILQAQGVAAGEDGRPPTLYPYFNSFWLLTTCFQTLKWSLKRLEPTTLRTRSGTYSIPLPASVINLGAIQCQQFITMAKYTSPCFHRRGCNNDPITRQRFGGLDSVYNI